MKRVNGMNGPGNVAERDGNHPGGRGKNWYFSQSPFDPSMPYPAEMR